MGIVQTQNRLVEVTEYESGLQIECTLTYLTYNISEQLRLRPDAADFGSNARPNRCWRQ